MIGKNEEASYPQGAPLTKLKHSEHTVLKLDCAIELGQVVVIDPQQLRKGQTKKVMTHGESPQSSCRDYKRICISRLPQTKIRGHR